jgi:hypothetical protein
MARVSKEQVFFDTFNDFSTRVVYNWLLPMGSRLYSEADVERLVADAGLSLADAAHDFVVPYGLYRKIPGAIAADIRSVDTAVGDTSVGERLASVSYWDARVPDRTEATAAAERASEAE